MSTKRPSVVINSDIIQKYVGSDYDKIVALANQVDAIADIIAKSDDLDAAIETVNNIIIEDNTYISDPLLDYPVDYSAEGFVEDTLGAILAAFALAIKLNEQNLDELKTGTGTIVIANNAAPVAYTNPAPANLTNDGFGVGTSSAYSPVNKGIIYDIGSDEFDFSLFQLGDIVTLRVDLNITTTNTNQEVKLLLSLAEGSPSAKVLNIKREILPAITTYNNEVAEITFHIDSQDMLDNPGHVQIESPDDASINVNSFSTFINTKITTA